MRWAASEVSGACAIPRHLDGWHRRLLGTTAKLSFHQAECHQPPESFYARLTDSILQWSHRRNPNVSTGSLEGNTHSSRLPSRTLRGPAMPMRLE